MQNTLYTIYTRLKPKKEECVCARLEILIVFCKSRRIISRSADDALSNAYIMKMKEELQQS